MSRLEQERDDIFREIQALSPRLQLQIAGQSQVVTAGQRTATGGWSIFFDQDPVYHFDDRGRLRRAFSNGHLFRTQGKTLARLTRERNAREVNLHRHDLEPAELDAFLAEMQSRLDALRGSLQAGDATVLREEPLEMSTITQLAEALDTIAGAALALADPIPTRRR